MKVMTLNCGSSSVKYALFDMPDGIRLCHGIVDRVTVGGSLIKHIKLDGQEYIHYQECPTHDMAVRLVIDFLTDRKRGVIKSLSEIGAVGHRVVHGGAEFTKPVIIDDEVMEKIKEFSTLAPLHNPPNL